MVNSSGDSFVNSKSIPDKGYIFAEDGYKIQKGDLVKEYMKSDKFVPAESVGKVGVSVGDHNAFLTLRPTTKSQVAELARVAQQPKGEVKPKVKTKKVLSTVTEQEKALIDQSSDIALVREAISAGDLEAAKSIYKGISKDNYLPSFDSLKAGVIKDQERQAAQLANEGVKSVKEAYGHHQDTVQKMKNFLRISAEKKNKKGTLYREHIPDNLFGVSSDEVATDLGMSENQFMNKLLSELDIQKTPVPKASRDLGVPRKQLPVGEGAEKASRLEARITESLDKTPQEIIDQLGSTYTQMSKPEQIARATVYVTENPSKAMQVLRGEIDAPPGILKNSIYVAMENQAKGNVPLARKLASLQSTRAGQELSILTEIDPNSPVKLIRELINVREEAFARRYKGQTPKDLSKKVTENIKKKVRVPNKNDWNSFVNSIAC